MAVREFDVARIATGLAFASAIPALHDALDRSNVAVISAAPGTGKTTLVPAVVANRVAGRVIVTQPRRVAARAAARRLASLDGSVVGDRVGFTVRGERRVSADTRVEMLTPGVLLRRLLTDADLAGVGAVIIDEVHERALETDVLIGILGEVRELREDLVVIAMSATVDAERFAALLAPEPAPIVAHEAVQHQLAVRWAPAEPRLDDRGVTPAFLRHVATVAAHAHADLVRSQPGSDALVFAPGVREVAAIARHVREISPEIDVRELHGQVPPQEQDDTIAGRPADARPRLIVATAIAESSLTVPGVSLVVDSCLSRVPRRDAARGMSGLVTTATSRASATQRAGRATRQGAGTVIRCVDERTFAAAPAFTTPEIATSDLTEVALTLAVWGAPGGRGLRLPDAPPAEAMEHAIANLRSIGAVDDEGRATAIGRELATIPADPRLAHALKDGTARFGTRAADVIALLSDTTISGSDLAETLRELRAGRHPQHRAWRREADRFARIAAAMPAGTADTDNLAGVVAALAFPTRIARRVADSQDGGIYLLASGTRAGLSGTLAQEPWIVVADVSRSTAKAAAGTGALIRAAAAISEAEALRCAPALLTDRVEADVVDGRVAARRERRLGAITLSSVPVKAEGESAVAAVGRALQREGTGLFAWTEEATTLRHRLALLHEHIGDPWPDVSEEALGAILTDWLEPEIAALAAGTPAARIDMAAALRRLLPWPHAARFDELAPTRLTVPSGSAIRVQYGEGEQPVVAVKLQECFGLTETPRIVEGRVPVLFHLLSPAGRPLAVTADLASFWAGPYAQVRAEMRGRYPKHPWPEDPHTHVATAKTKRRLAP